MAVGCLAYGVAAFFIPVLFDYIFTGFIPVIILLGIGYALYEKSNGNRA
jgi:hypothetical protein